MMDLFRRTIARLSGTRALEAGSGGRRWAPGQRVANLNADIQTGGVVAGQRAEWFATNNPLAQSAINTWVHSLVGSGIKLRCRHPDAAIRDAIHSMWLQWSDGPCDGTGNRDTLDALVALAVRGMIVSGESFATMAVDQANDSVPLTIALVDPAQLPITSTWNIPPSNLIRASIEFSPSGKRVAYHILPHNPNDPTVVPLVPAWEPVRVPAEDVCHLFKPLVSNQLRGVTWFSPVLTRLRELDAYQDAALARAKTAALFCGFIKDVNDNAGGMAGVADASGVASATLEPATLTSLPPGTDITFSTPPDDRGYADFTKDAEKQIAAGLGVAYHQLSADTKEANYSSLRAAMVEFRTSLEAIQYNIIVPKLLRPIYDRWIKLAVLSGRIEAPDYFTNPGAYAVDWLMPSLPWVDPKKDIEATIAAIEAGLDSRAAAAARLGLDVEQLDAEIAADRAREDRLGLSFSAVARLTPPMKPLEQPAGDAANG